jgi:hypothetical protein
LLEARAILGGKYTTTLNLKTRVVEQSKAAHVAQFHVVEQNEEPTRPHHTNFRQIIHTLAEIRCRERPSRIEFEKKAVHTFYHVKDGILQPSFPRLLPHYANHTKNEQCK